MNQYKVLGILCTEKDAKKFFRLYLAGDFSDYAKEHALKCVGVETITEFTNLDCSTINVGDTIQLFYARGFEGKAKLVGIEKVTVTK